MTVLREYQQDAGGIQASASDDCVRILTETGALFGETREKIQAPPARRSATRRSPRCRQARQAIVIWYGSGSAPRNPVA